MGKIKGALPPLEPKLAREYLARAQAGDETAKDLLVRHNLLLVKTIAARFAGEQPDDLFQVGCIGLLKAVANFDLNRDTSFSTYAVPRIIGEIRMYLRDNRPIKVSRDLLRVSGQVKSCRRRLEQTLDREPSIGEVAAELNLSAEEVAAAETAMAPLADLSEADSPEFIDDLRIVLKEIIGFLEARERQVIALRYFEELSQQQVAKKLAISQGHVSRVERQVLQKLKKALS